MMEFLTYVPTIYGALALAISLVDGLRKWADGEFADSDVFDPATEDRITGVLGAVVAFLRPIAAGLSAFNTTRRK